MHPWILEGLPPKVLSQHKKMLGLEVFDGDKTSRKKMAWGDSTPESLEESEK